MLFLECCARARLSLPKAESWTLTTRSALHYGYSSAATDYYAACRHAITPLEVANAARHSQAARLAQYYGLYVLHKLTSQRYTRVYVPFYFDSRGRLYENSIIGATSSKPMRFSRDDGVYTTAEIAPRAKCRHVKMSDQCADAIQQVRKRYHILLSSDRIDVAIVWHLIGMGELISDKKIIEAKMRDLVSAGLALLNTNGAGLCLDDAMEFAYYERTLCQFADKVIRRRIVAKDASASVMQHLVRLIGCENVANLKFVNLAGGDSFFDPYTGMLAP